MQILFLIHLWSIPLVLTLHPISEIVLLHDGTFEQFEPSMEWPQRLNMVLRNLKFRQPKIRLTVTESLLAIQKLKMGNHSNLVGLITIARCDRGNILESVAQKMYPQVPILRIDTEYCHEPSRLLLTWLKVDWPCFQFVFQNWVERVKVRHESSHLPIQNNYDSIANQKCPFRVRIATHVVDAYQEKFRRNILNGRTIRVGAVNLSSLVRIYGDPNDPKSLRYSGTMAEDVESVAFALNYTIKLVIPKDRKLGMQTNNGSWSGLMALAIANGFDFMGYPTTFTYPRYQVLDWIFAGTDNTFAFIIPPPEVGKNWLASAQPYNYKVWLYIIGSLLLLGFLSEFNDRIRAVIKPRLSVRKSSLWHVFNYFRVLLNQGGDDAINQHSSQIVMGFWCVFALVAINLYTSQLTGFLTLPQVKPVISNLQDLAESNSIRMVFYNDSSVTSVIMNPNVTGPMAVIANRARKHPEDFAPDRESALEQVALGSRVVLEASGYIHEALAEDYKEHGRCRLAMIPYNFATIPYSYGTPKGSPYWHYMYNARARIVEVGIFKQIKKKFLQPSPCLDFQSNLILSAHSLNVSDLMSPFVFYAIGVACCIIIFLSELLLTRTRRRSEMLSDP